MMIKVSNKYFGERQPNDIYSINKDSERSIGQKKVKVIELNTELTYLHSGYRFSKLI